MRPTVSVVVATYNWSSALACALRSVQLQTFEDYEVLVVGDGCTDDSEAIVATFNDERFRWHNLERNCGSQWAPNNYGLAAASGEWVAYLGHDDIWYPTHLASCLRTSGEQAADLVAGVTILYGPPGSGFRAVSGVYPSGHYARSDFMPPSSILHRLSLVEQIGPWKDPETIALPTDCAFLQDATDAGARIASTAELTVFKFNAAWRRDAYKHKDVAEQKAMLEKIESGFDFRPAEFMGVLQAALNGRFSGISMPRKGAPGHFHKLNRYFKGVGDPYATTELNEITVAKRFFLDLTAPFEWHEIETSKPFGPFRWSGPLKRSTVDLPVKADRDLMIEVHILAAITPDILRSLRLFVCDRPVEFEIEATTFGTFLMRATALSPANSFADDFLRLTFQVEETLRPCEVQPGSGDRRSLGLAVNWIEITPKR